MASIVQRCDNYCIVPVLAHGYWDVTCLRGVGASHLNEEYNISKRLIALDFSRRSVLSHSYCASGDGKGKKGTSINQCSRRLNFD